MGEAAVLLKKELLRGVGWGCWGAPVVTVQACAFVVGPKPPGAERLVSGLSADRGDSREKFSRENGSGS